MGDVALDPERHEVVIRGDAVSLPLKEFELLELLLANAGRVLPRETLIDRVWGTDYVGDTKTLDVHVKRLRAKVEPDPSTPTRIVTIRGLGYKYDVPAGLTARVGAAGSARTMGSMSTPAGWEPLPVAQAAGGRGRLPPVAVRAAGPHPRAGGRRRRAGHDRAGQLAVLRPRPERRPLEGLPLPGPHDGAARGGGPVHRARRSTASVGGRRWMLDRRHGRSRARVLRDDRRPPEPAAVPGGVRGAGDGQGLRGVAQRHRAHRRARRRRAGRGQLEAPAAVGPRGAAGRDPGRRSPSPSPARRACWWSRWSSTPPPRWPALRIPATQVAAAPATEAEAAELHGAGIRLAASAMGLVRGIVGFLTFLLLFDLRDDPTWQIGVVLVLSGAGALVGSALAPSLRRGLAEERMLMLALVGRAWPAASPPRGSAAWRAACCSPPSSRSCRRRAGWPSTRSCSATLPTPTGAGRSPSFELRFQIVWVVGAVIPVLVAIPLTVGLPRHRRRRRLRAVHLRGRPAAAHRAHRRPTATDPTTRPHRPIRRRPPIQDDGRHRSRPDRSSGPDATTRSAGLRPLARRQS